MLTNLAECCLLLLPLIPNHTPCTLADRHTRTQLNDLVLLASEAPFADERLTIPVIGRSDQAQVPFAEESACASRLFWGRI